MAPEAELETELRKARKRIAELEREQKRTDKQAAAHIRLMLRHAEIKVALDNVLNRIASDGIGDRYPVRELVTDLEAIRTTVLAFGEK